jgi:hypothetical protein
MSLRMHLEANYTDLETNPILALNYMITRASTDSAWSKKNETKLAWSSA